MKRNITRFLALIILLPLWVKAQPNLSEAVKELDAYIAAARVQWEVPGMSVTIVKDGEVLLSKGYGTLGIHNTTPIDGQSLFMIGSTTKAMTAHALAHLIDQGKAKWDDLVIQHLPWFALKDPCATEKLRLIDLFTHNSGLGNTDLLWVLWDYPTEEIVRRVRYKDPAYDFRSGYTYQNVMYATAGLVIEALSGQSWGDYIHSAIWQPLGMNRTFAHRSDVTDQTNRARPHYPTDKGIIEIIDSNADSIDAAGSVWSCSDDMAKWLIYLLNKNQFLQPTTFELLNSPQILLSRRQFYPSAALTEANLMAYGLGWFFHDYRGDLVQFHTGSLNGATAIIGLLPKHQIGIYVSGNLDHAELRHALIYKTFDLLRDNDQKDWSTLIKNLYDNIAAERIARAKPDTPEKNETNPSSLVLAEYKGVYTNEFLGNIYIGLVEGQLQVQFRPDRTMTLTHWNGDYYKGGIDQYALFESPEMVEFIIKGQKVEEFKLYGYTFKKRAATK